jgi:short-subunit dehydrogenase
MKNKVVIITGASSGIGKACAEVFAAQGATVVIAARNSDSLAELEETLVSRGARVLSVTCDVQKQFDCERLIEETVKKFGRIDALINSAGISMRALFVDTDLEVLKKVVDTNFWGTVYCTKYALPHLLKTKGSVVGVSSVSGKKALPGRTGYCASKFAVEGFLETLRIENLKTGLHVLVACPGFTASNIRYTALTKDGSPQGESPRDERGMMQAEEVAVIIAESIRKRKRDFVLTLEGKALIFLNKFFPSWMDKLVYNKMVQEPDSPLKK